jgi:ferredoxin--NADP+ reductase
MITAGHVVAIFGGAVAGSEAAAKLTERGIRCVIFEQNALPYGKIENGLPKWHVKLRDKEESKINDKLNHPLVHFVPEVKLGKDLDFNQVVNQWGFSAILLATGAWRDRSLNVGGIDAYIDKGLYYQNSFVSWFNKNHDPAYTDTEYHIPDETIIIGGGLASIDVAKIVMIETVRRALEKIGHVVNVLAIEKKGIPHLLSTLNLRFEDLGLRGCTLYYRRRLIDMPLSSLPKDPTEKDLATAYHVRKKIMDNVLNKFLFRFEECRQAVDKIVEGEGLCGLVFQKTEVVDGRLRVIPDSDYVKAVPLIISAIGSVPEPIPGLPYTGDAFEIVNQETGQIAGRENVFALGNAVTGRGNIKESQMHGRQVSEKIMDEFFAWREDDYAQIFDRAVVNADHKIELISDSLMKDQILSVEHIQHLLERVNNLQRRVGYNGNYDQWIVKHLPQRVENMVDRSLT